MKDLIITPRLSRAARALLDWQQTDLAVHASLSLSAIKDFEAGSDKTRKATFRAIQNAFENNGVEFPATGGVRTVDDIATIARFSGTDFVHKWNEDIFQACTQPGQEILTSSISEALWTGPHVKQANARYLKWIEQQGIVHKSIVPEGHKVFNLPPQCYRTVPAAMIGKVTYVLYADRLAFVLWKKKQIIVIRNASIVETFRSQFDFLWKMGRSIVG